LAGERCRSNSNWYCCRHIDSRRRGVSGGRRTSSVPRNRKMRVAASECAKSSETLALMRSGKRKVGETLS
jgi:hypothetical protein